MQPLHILIAHPDSMAAATLAHSLRQHFRGVATISSLDDLRGAIVEQGIEIVVLDLEMVTPTQLEELCCKFRHVGFVGVHRVADEELWARVLDAGAVDCCSTNDVVGITHAARHYAETAHISAA